MSYRHYRYCCSCGESLGEQALTDDRDECDDCEAFQVWLDTHGPYFTEAPVESPDPAPWGHPVCPGCLLELPLSQDCGVCS